MMSRVEEQERLAMQRLIKFEVEAEKQHQEFTLAEVTFSKRTRVKLAIDDFFVLLCLSFIRNQQNR